MSWIKIDRLDNHNTTRHYTGNNQWRSHSRITLSCRNSVYTFTEKLEIKNPTDTAKSINWNDLLKPFVCEKLLKNNTRDWDKINSLTKIITIVFQ
jgi:hypothetical protein